jgi:KH domain
MSFGCAGREGVLRGQRSNYIGLPELPGPSMVLISDDTLLFSARMEGFLQPVSGFIANRVLVASEMVGAIIGRQGGTIRQITQQTRAR